MEIINKKPLSEIKEEKEIEKNEMQADIFEVVACLYEEIEGIRAEVVTLKAKIEGGAKQ
ncbi:hypothetical protein [Tissierella praeacuta]|uniref:hypothetical protein n=1 Tax=Tissierella praeacuta TaxID=43131 RepID=UPI002FDB46D0